VGAQVKQTYGMKVTTILHATEQLSADLEYLCSLVEKPDPEFKIRNAIVYAHAVMTLSTHLDFVLEELTRRDLKDLEELCGISLQNN
jgi:hypothetical protein